MVGVIRWADSDTCVLVSWVFTGLTNGLLPVWCQGITWTSAQLVSTGPPQKHMDENWPKHISSWKYVWKCRLQNFNHCVFLTTSSIIRTLGGNRYLLISLKVLNPARHWLYIIAFKHRGKVILPNVITKQWFIWILLTFIADWNMHNQTYIISGTLVGNKIVDHTDVAGVSPVGAAPTTSSSSTKHLA